MVDIEDLKSSDSNVVWVRVPPRAQYKKDNSCCLFYIVPEEYDTCVSYGGTRKSGVCFGSNQNNEEQEARNFCDDKNLLAEEIPTSYTNSFTCGHESLNIIVRSAPIL